MSASGSIPPSTPGKPWQPPSAEELRDYFPQYEIVALLGRGGMGAVYKGWQRSLDRFVAIKILPPGMDDADVNYTERFKQEAKSMAKLMHPGIVAVFDAGETPTGLLYFVMEFVEGTDVAHMLQSQGKLPPEHALAITAHVCDALGYAHRHGIVHRDIKPANIMVNMEGAVKVADFGLAKHSGPGARGLTKTNMAMGTPDYVAPEALIAGIEVDARADLYAVGVMLYQMLTGNIPRGMFTMPSALVKTDPRFDLIIAKAMQTDREQRYESAAMLRRDLDVILSVPLVKAGDAHSSAAIPKQQLPPKPVARGPQKPGEKNAGAPARAAQSSAPPRGAAGAGGNESGMPDSRTQAAKKSSTGLYIGLAAAVIVFGAMAVLFTGTKPAAELAGSAAVIPDAIPSPPVPLAGTTKPPVITTPAPKPAESTAAPAPAPTAAAPTETTPAAPAIVRPAEAKVAAIAPMSPIGESKAAAAPADPVAVRLAEVEKQFLAAYAQQVTAPHSTAVANLNRNYIARLDRDIAAAARASQLEDALALRNEKQQVETQSTVPDEDAADLRAVLKPLRQTYRDTMATLVANRDKLAVPLHNAYDKALAIYQDELTKSQKLDEAARVKAAREQIAANRGGAAAAASSAATRPAGTNAPNAALAGASAPPSNMPLAAATKDKPFTNSLGMKFIPVRSTDVLFCIHEVRHRDYAAYAAENPGVDDLWKNQTHDGYAITDRADDHPVVNVSWEDATRFCAWLSKKEGRTYRLPTDQEWSCAVGIGRTEKWKSDTTPATVFQDQNEFPWHGDYPPRTKDKPGNYSDASRKAKAPRGDGTYMADYDDGFPTTAPVMSFKANKLDLFDMGGNVWEWVEDWFDSNKNERELRGGGWTHHDRVYLLSSSRYHLPPFYRSSWNGFRCVLVPAGAAAVTQPPPPTTTTTQTGGSVAVATKDKPFTNSLGMKFVPVPDTQALFCIHETRRQDYAAYATEVPGVNTAWKDQQERGVAVGGQDDHPVVAVSWDDAQAFCAWLSKKEGRLYRLPTDREWSMAVGIAREEKWKADTTPFTVFRVPGEYPWGDKWPPPKGAGNYCDLSYKEALNPTAGPPSCFLDYNDGFSTTAPVMSFKPNRYGLYDLGGNVWEWVEDWFDPVEAKRRTSRGSCWSGTSGLPFVTSSVRGNGPPGNRWGGNGFRVVLAPSGAAP